MCRGKEIALFLLPVLEILFSTTAFISGSRELPGRGNNCGTVSSAALGHYFLLLTAKAVPYFEKKEKKKSE